MNIPKDNVSKDVLNFEKEKVVTRKAQDGKSTLFREMFQELKLLNQIQAGSNRYGYNRSYTG